MRNQNIFIRNETLHSIEYHGGDVFPTFAAVTNVDADGNVYYEVDYIVGPSRRWYYHDWNEQSGTHILPADEFRRRFRPDLQNIYSRYVREEAND